MRHLDCGEVLTLNTLSSPFLSPLFSDSWFEMRKISLFSDRFLVGYGVGEEGVLIFPSLARVLDGALLHELKCINLNLV